MYYPEVGLAMIIFQCIYMREGGGRREEGHGNISVYMEEGRREKGA
jgi:hypothetical protein